MTFQNSLSAVGYHGFPEHLGSDIFPHIRPQQLTTVPVQVLVLRNFRLCKMLYHPTIHWRTATSWLYLACQLQNRFRCNWENSVLRCLFCLQPSLHLLPGTFETRAPRCLTSRQQLLCPFDDRAAISSSLLSIVAKLSQKSCYVCLWMISFMLLNGCSKLLKLLELWL